MEKPKILSNKDSLEIITKMIEQARENMESKMGSSVLLQWGYTTVLVGLTIGTLAYMDIWPYRSFLWLLIPIICYPRIVLFFLKKRDSARSYIDISINYISILYILICTSVAAASIWVVFPVFFIEGLLISMWTVTIGVLVKFKKIMIGGIVGIVLSHIFLLIGDLKLHIFLFVLIVIFSIVIPGHLFSASLSIRDKES